MTLGEHVFKPSPVRRALNFFFHAFMFFFYAMMLLVLVTSTGSFSGDDAPLLLIFMAAVLVAAFIGALSIVLKRSLKVTVALNSVVVTRLGRTIGSFSAEEFSFDTELIEATVRGYTSVNRFLTVCNRQTEQYKRLSIKYLRKKDFSELDELLKSLNKQEKARIRRKASLATSGLPQTFNLNKSGNLRAARKTVLLASSALLAVILFFALLLVLSVLTDSKASWLMIGLSIVMFIVSALGLVYTFSWYRKIRSMPETLVLTHDCITVDSAVFPLASIKEIVLAQPYQKREYLSLAISTYLDEPFSDFVENESEAEINEEELEIELVHSFVLGVWTRSGTPGNYSKIYHTLTKEYKGICTTV